MTYRKLILLFTFLLLSKNIFAQEKGVGIGMIFGEPVALECKRWIDSVNAIDFGLGSSVATQNNRLTIFIDYIWHVPTLIKSKENFPGFYGVGLISSVRTDESSMHGIRVVGGMMWYLSKKFPFDFFIEAAPTLVLYPYLGFRLNMGGGLRYYFDTKD